MEIPSSITVLHRRFRVHEMSEEVSSLSNSEGLVDFETDRIYINTRLPESQVLETLLHEVGHAVNVVADVGDQTHEEDAVLRTTPIWLTVWRDNPQLLTLLSSWVSDSKGH